MSGRQREGLFHNAIFFIGWLLSPFTFWNDALVNIPLAYLAASLMARFIRPPFLLSVLVCYWLTNVLGLYLMYLGGKGLVGERERPWRVVLGLLVTIALYSLILILFDKCGLSRNLQQQLKSITKRYCQISGYPAVKL